ncbi:MAG: winged helix-turn-helix domain-containing tetratricopeptide repeat protein [Steroidobacteraceae bacterium]
MNAEPTSDPASVATRYQVDDLVIDTLARRVTREGSELPLTSLSFDLLLALACAAPNLVSFDALIERAWSGAVVSPEAVTQRVKQLRQALGDNAERPRYILAVRGHGYRMPTAAAPLAAAPRSPLDAVATVNDAPSAVLNRRWLLALALAFVVAVGGVWWGFGRTRRAQPPLHAAVVAATAPAGSIAVMPFSNLTGDPSKDYFGDGMAEEMINALGQVPGLKVPARTSSFAYKGRNIDVRRIAQELGVSTVLEGSVRSAGSRIRITAQLVDARSGYQMWSQSYDRQFGDIFKLQDDLAGAILKALRININGSTPPSLARVPPTQNVEAYDLYLQGQAMMFVADHGLQRALERFQRALALDPKFARAYVGVALVKFLSGISGAPPIENLAEATRAAQKALALDPGLATAHSALANIAFAQHHWLAAETQMRAALSLGQGEAVDHFSHGILLVLVGHLQQSLAELDKALLSDPTHLDTIRFRAFVLSLLGRDTEALKEARLGATLGDTSPALPYLAAAAAIRSGHFADAAAQVMAVPDPADPDQARTAEVTKLIYAALADPRKKAVAMAARARLYPRVGHGEAGSQASTNVTSCLASSYTYALLGELDTVYDMANQCLDAAVPGAIDSGSYLSLWRPELSAFRQDPRFQALATRLGLMDYWKQYGPPDQCELKDGKLACH